MAALVAIDPQDAAIDHPLSYLAPEGEPLPAPGERVQVPLRQRVVRGWVVAHAPAPGGVRLKRIVGVGPGEERCPADALALARWLAHRYLAPLGAAIDIVAPPPARRGAPRGFGGVASDARADGLQGPGSPEPPLTVWQREALAPIVEAIQRRQAQRFLLWGVTASGKTRVYEEAVAACLQAGRSAVLLVPEIALTPQLVGSLRRRFGDRIAVLHSQMAAGWRRHHWERVRSGEARVVVGARSAVLAPVADVGLFVLDEEHESSYKQDESPRYHAREVALHRATEAGATVVLGSATPSLESMQAALDGQLRLLRLPERIDARPMPSARIVDLREELAATGEVSPISRPLREALREVVAHREQAIVFVNRRGFSGALICRACGFSWRCPHCDVGLTYHHGPGRGLLRCHYCGYETEVTGRCPRCGDEEITAVGFGTQRVQATLAAAFPGVPVLRMDADTTGRRDAHRRILDAFARQAPAILVGTQMVAKGHDFPGVTLAAAVLADVTLQLPDFRAAERTFQHLVQVAGRAGRGPRPGQVIVQTFQPDHPSIRAAVSGEVERFYQRELAFRRRWSYPPFGELVRLVAQDPEEPRARGAAVEMARRLEEAAAGRSGVKVLGPAPAPLARLRDRWRWQVVVRGPSPLPRELVRDLVESEPLTGALRPESVVVDPDPVDVL